MAREQGSAFRSLQFGAMGAPLSMDLRQRILEAYLAHEELKPLWAALSQAAEELDREAGDVLAALKRLERAMDRSSLSERVRRI